MTSTKRLRFAKLNLVDPLGNIGITSKSLETNMDKWTQTRHKLALNEKMMEKNMFRHILRED